MDDRRTHRHGRPLQHGAGGPALSRPAFPTARRQLIERVPPHRGVQARFPPIPEMTDMTTLSVISGIGGNLACTPRCGGTRSISCRLAVGNAGLLKAGPPA